MPKEVASREYLAQIGLRHKPRVEELRRSGLSREETIRVLVVEKLNELLFFSYWLARGSGDKQDRLGWWNFVRLITAIQDILDEEVTNEDRQVFELYGQLMGAEEKHC